MTTRLGALCMVWFAVCCPLASAEDPPAGPWHGAIAAAGMEIGIQVDFQTEGGALAATIDIPQQGAAGLPLTHVVFTAPRIHFELPAPPGLAVFDGEVKGDQIAGDFTQAGMKGTFSLKRGRAPKAAPEAREPVPYEEREVTFANGEIKLAGTLTLPRAAGPFAAVILITGSGPQNRDEELFGFKPFRILADHLTRNGIAVLRCDDRGVGGSTGKVAESTTEDFAGDALAGVAFLTTQKEIDPRRIGLCGHSEGGVVAPIAAARSQDVAFIVLLSGTGVPGEQVLVTQGEAIGLAAGIPLERIRANQELQRHIFAAVRSGKGWDELRAEMRGLARAQIDALPEPQKKAIADVDAYLNGVVEGELKGAQTPWFKYFLDFDPAPTLEKVKCPVLMLFGELDLQVPPAVNRAPMEAALRKGGNPDVAVEVLPHANHLYQSALTGGPNEYPSLKRAFVPGFLDLITAWILKRTQTAK